MASCAVKAEEKKVPLRPDSEELIAAVMALPVDKRTYIKIFKIGIILYLLTCFVRSVTLLRFSLNLSFLVSGDPDVPKLKLKAVDAGKKKRSSTESGSSSDIASETIASRMKRAKRAAAVTSKGAVELDPFMARQASSSSWLHCQCHSS